MSNCCKICLTECDNPGCFSITLRELNDLLYALKHKIAELSFETNNWIKYGFANSCDNTIETKKMTSYLEALEGIYYTWYKTGNICLCDESFESLINNVKSVIDYTCFTEYRTDLIIDKSQEDLWIAQNPYCTSLEDWEHFSTRVCDIIKLDVERLRDNENLCNIVFDIVKEVISCDVLFAVSMHKEFCDIGLTISRTEEQCKIDFGLLLEKHMCDITYDEYLKLIDCNVSYDIIDTILDCGIEVRYSSEKSCPVLITNMGTYTFAELHLENINENTCKNISKYTNNECELNTELLVEKLKSDYC